MTVTKSEVDAVIRRAVKRALRAERARIESALRKSYRPPARVLPVAYAGLDERLAALRARLDRLVPEQRR